MRTVLDLLLGRRWVHLSLQTVAYQRAVLEKAGHATFLELCREWQVAPLLLTDGSPNPHCRELDLDRAFAAESRLDLLSTTVRDPEPLLAELSESGEGFAILQLEAPPASAREELDATFRIYSLVTSLGWGARYLEGVDFRGDRVICHCPKDETSRAAWVWDMQYASLRPERARLQIRAPGDLLNRSWFEGVAHVTGRPSWIEGMGRAGTRRRARAVVGAGSDRTLPDAREQAKAERRRDFAQEQYQREVLERFGGEALREACQHHSVKLLLR